MPSLWPSLLRLTTPGRVCSLLPPTFNRGQDRLEQRPKKGDQKGQDLEVKSKERIGKGSRTVYSEGVEMSRDTGELDLKTLVPVMKEGSSAPPCETAEGRTGPVTRNQREMDPALIQCGTKRLPSKRVDSLGGSPCC